MSLLDNVTEKKLPEHGSQYKSFKEVDGNYVISPSGLRTFLSNKREWYENTVLKQSTFTGNEASTLGSLIHQYAEDYYNEDLNKDGSLQDWKLKQIMGGYNLKDKFNALYPVFRDVYLENSIKPERMEGYLEYDLQPNIKLAGSFDFLIKENDKYVIGDYKTSSKSFKDIEGYILQLSCYCLLLELTEGIKVDKIRVVGIITTKEPKIIIVEDKPKVDFVKDLLTDMVHSIDIVKDYPDLERLLFPYNYFDMFNSGDSKKRIGSSQPMFKELDRNILKVQKLQQTVFG